MNVSDDTLRELLEDKARLDLIESLSNGNDWAARMSTTGRGFRLHNSTGDWDGGKGKTAREAIDDLNVKLMCKGGFVK